MEILIILLLVFIVWPIVKIAWKMRQVRRDIFNAQQQYQQQYQQGQRNQQQQQRRRDTYNPDEGEYVEFEEITSSTVTEQTSADGETYYQESQISDAEFEEIQK